jgi:DNA-binding transcriptional ArsR family regulator
MSEALNLLLPRLRAIAEPSRLRLLAVLARGEFSVSELTEILGQSQPRISRHLKLLDDAGLLERFREQHWIYYRVPVDTGGGRLARLILEQLDTDDPELATDAERLQRVLEARAGRAGPGEGTAAAPAGTEDLAPLIAAELGDQGRDAMLYFGPAPDELLARLGAKARRAVGMNPSRPVVQRARARLHSAGLNHCVLQQGELATLPYPSNGFDLVVVDRSLADVPRPAEALREAARMLRTSGRLLLVEDFDALERRASGSHPLALLRGWLAEAGLACQRLHPFDVNGAHLLLAAATPEPEAAAA